ncbi:hypothetical protein MIND_01040500 [Mycena indigotica]|uniref:MARVEL domain-containing protein n=1 Tax=Mycena indigotica TaxID=2126181 RepID=A0A8H6S8Y6_9AGAR|nr:uncharacterized protein MIND_01040500 [Mycena indigotica]KAF7295024.1 hypothetical protein MIND_01040500 [Mycena indigotica]
MHFLVTARYLVFAAFIICNAILASAAVWNQSLVPSSARISHLDIYLTTVGALGLFLTFSIIFVELIRKNAPTSRVYFEITWCMVFFVMDLAAAAALTAVGPADMCSNGETHPVGGCTSVRVLLGFTWLCTFILLIYLVLLLLLTYINRNNESIPKIWQCPIHNFPPLNLSRPPSITLPRFTPNEMAQAVVVTPRRPPTAPGLQSFGLDAQYQIEHFHPPESPPSSPVSPVASPADPLHRNPSSAGNAQAAVALYPRFISSAYVPSDPPQPIGPRAQSPPPLGDWPRTHPPLRIKRKPVDRAVSPTRPIGPRTRSRPLPPDPNREQENL